MRTQKWEDSAIAAFSTDLAWRLCPRCGANIRREAIKCRACKEFLPAARVPLVPLVPPQAAPEPAPAQKVQPSRLTRAALAVLVVAAVVLLLMWLRSDRIRPAPGSSVGQGAGGMV